MRPSSRENAEIGLAVARCARRISRSLGAGFEYHHSAMARSDRFLRRHDSERPSMFVLFVDLANSTKMSSELRPEALARIIRIYSQEMAYVIEHYGGYVLKYVGDAVIGYFPSRSRATAKRTVLCAQSMASVVESAINPALDKDGYPKLGIKVTIDFGPNSIVRYGSDRRRSHIDIIGLPINLAAKMQTLGRAGQAVIRKNLQSTLPPSMAECFARLRTGSATWSYHDLESRKPYSVFVVQLSPPEP